MSLSDRTGTARSFVLTSRSGLDATFVCTNPPAGYTGVSLVQRQTRPTKPGAKVAVNVKCIITYVDPVTGSLFDDDVSVTLRFRNDDRSTAYQERLQDAATMAVRSLMPFDTATIVGTAVATNINNSILGALPTP